MLLLGACADRHKVTYPVSSGKVVAQPFNKENSNFMLKATVFRMSGDYADNVAITLRPDGTLAYYPAPSDISGQSRPVSLGNGWWLNRQGLGPGSVFTRFTFEEYARLKNTPSQKELIDAIIPGAKVIEMRRLDIPASEAARDPKKASELLK